MSMYVGQRPITEEVLGSTLTGEPDGRAHARRQGVSRYTSSVTTKRDVLVYRVESETGQKKGPYHGAVAMNFDYDVHSDMKTHPSPHHDKDEYGMPVWIMRDEVCGHLSLRESAAWFEGYAEELDAHGYQLVAYAIPQEHVRVARRQVVFNKEQATQVHSMRVNDHYK